MAKAAKKAKRKLLALDTWATFFQDGDGQKVGLASSRSKARNSAKLLKAMSRNEIRIARVRITEL